MQHSHWCYAPFFKKFRMSTMIGCEVNPLSNIVAMEVFFHIIDICWEHVVEEAPTLIPLCYLFVRLVANGLQYPGGALALATSNLEGLGVPVLVYIQPWWKSRSWLHLQLRWTFRFLLLSNDYHFNTPFVLTTFINWSGLELCVIHHVTIHITGMRRPRLKPLKLLLKRPKC